MQTLRVVGEPCLFEGPVHHLTAFLEGQVTLFLGAPLLWHVPVYPAVELCHNSCMTSNVHQAMGWGRHIARVANFPKPGVEFFDITPLLADPDAFARLIDAWAQRYVDAHLTRIVAIESRGFVLGTALATRLKTGLVLMRKPGKLPRVTYAQSYELEYGQAQLEVHQDDLNVQDRVLVVDDVLATGGTLEAALALVTRSGAQVYEATVLIEIAALQGRRLLAGAPVHSILTY